MRLESQKTIRLSELRVGEIFKLIETAHTTVRGFIYKEKPEDNEFVLFKVLKVNKTTIVAENQNDGALLYFKFTNTGHWRSAGKNCFVEVIPQ